MKLSGLTCAVSYFYCIVVDEHIAVEARAIMPRDVADFSDHQGLNFQYFTGKLLKLSCWTQVDRLHAQPLYRCSCARDKNQSECKFNNTNYTCDILLEGSVTALQFARIVRFKAIEENHANREFDIITRQLLHRSLRTVSSAWLHVMTSQPASGYDSHSTALATRTNRCLQLYPTTIATCLFSECGHTATSLSSDNSALKAAFGNAKVSLVTSSSGVINQLSAMARVTGEWLTGNSPWH